jgi:hypothetical protein
MSSVDGQPGQRSLAGITPDVAAGCDHRRPSTAKEQRKLVGWPVILGNQFQLWPRPHVAMPTCPIESFGLH